MPPVPKHASRPSTANSGRPAIPHQHFNPLLKTYDPTRPPPVKFQRIARPPREVLVGRMKIPTPGSGHAFILRRYDTGAISITTLFKAAFPTASDHAEREEIGWVSHNFDLTGANGGTDEDRVRFSGRWANPTIAQKLAEEYGIGHLLPTLIEAKPDPTGAYRGGPRASTAQDAPASPSPPNKQLATPSPTAGPPPAKRRKEASPVRAPVAPTPARAAAASPAAKPRSPSPVRRSTRQRATQSPAPPPLTGRGTSPRKPLSRGMPQNLTVLSDETAVGDDSEHEDDTVAKLAHPDMNEDIAEQRALIDRLKAQRDAELLEKGDADVPTNLATGVTAAGKRERAEDKEVLLFEFKEPETEERALVTNSRLRGMHSLPPERKSVAWGALAFAAGLGIATFVPNFFF